MLRLELETSELEQLILVARLLQFDGQQFNLCVCDE